MAEQKSDVSEDAHTRKQLTELAGQFQTLWTDRPGIGVTLTLADHSELDAGDPRTWGKFRTEFDGADEVVGKLKAFMERGTELLHDLDFAAIKDLPAGSIRYSPWSHELWLHALMVTLPHLPLMTVSVRTTAAGHIESQWSLERVAKYCEMFANHLAETDSQPVAKSDHAHQTVPGEQSNGEADDALPDEFGYVKNPVDPKNYRRQKYILESVVSTALPINKQNFAQLRKNFSANRIRWTYELTKDGNPDRHRPRIHLPDFDAYQQRELQKLAGDGEFIPSPEQVAKGEAEFLPEWFDK